MATLSALIIMAVLGAGPGSALETAREIPAHALPVPETASPALQALIAAPLPPWWNKHPKSAQDWKDFVAERAAMSLKAVAALREKMNLKVEPTVIGGVKAFVITPGDIPEANRNRLLIHVHGGAYVLGPGEAGLPEALLMAGHGHFKVISIDYRMPPDFPYPAVIDDAMAVYKEVIKTTDPKKLAIFGTSTGGGMTMIMVLSPVYGDLKGFPPTILTNGTRDLFLGNTVRVRPKLREAGVVADLIVFEGLSQTQYLFDANAPESKEHFAETAAFFDKHLDK